MNITIHSVQHYFGSRQVLSDININVSSGEFLGIIGPNGAGKSTLLKILAGILPFGFGKIKIGDQEIEKIRRKDLAMLIGYVPQGVDVPFDFSVRDVVELGRYPYQRGFAQKDKLSSTVVDHALEWMDLQELQDRIFTNLSGGEKQRAIIASALAQEPEILLLDEPTSALDLKHQQQIYRILRDFSVKEKKTVILVTHDINLAAQFCDRLILLHKGKLHADGPPEEVLQFPVIQEVYGVKVYIDVNPFTKSIYILPYDTQN